MLQRFDIPKEIQPSCLLFHANDVRCSFRQLAHTRVSIGAQLDLPALRPQNAHLGADQQLLGAIEGSSRPHLQPSATVLRFPEAAIQRDRSRNVPPAPDLVGERLLVLHHLPILTNCTVSGCAEAAIELRSFTLTLSGVT